MSSDIHLSFEKPIPLVEWNWFCSINGIEYSPQTVGQNVFYYGGHGGVEVEFGESMLASGQCDFSKATPFPEATHIVVKTFFMRDLDSVALVAGKVLKRFAAKHGGSFFCSEELAEAMRSRLKRAGLGSIPEREPTP